MRLLLSHLSGSASNPRLSLSMLACLLQRANGDPFSPDATLAPIVQTTSVDGRVFHTVVAGENIPSVVELGSGEA